jgi:hypothetical protein
VTYKRFKADIFFKIYFSISAEEAGFELEAFSSKWDNKYP